MRISKNKNSLQILQIILPPISEFRPGNPKDNDKFL